MQLSRRAEYALLALIDLAVEARGERVQLKEIAQRQDLPEKYLEQLLRPLKTAGVVLSTRGSRGGYELARSPDDLTLLEIYEAVEGPLNSEEEPAGQQAQRVVHAFWGELMAAVREHLAARTLAQLAADYRAGRRSANDWVI